MKHSIRQVSLVLLFVILAQTLTFPLSIFAAPPNTLAKPVIAAEPSLSPPEQVQPGTRASRFLSEELPFSNETLPTLLDAAPTLDLPAVSPHGNAPPAGSPRQTHGMRDPVSTLPDVVQQAIYAPKSAGVAPALPDPLAQQPPEARAESPSPVPTATLPLTETQTQATGAPYAIYLPLIMNNASAQPAVRPVQTPVVATALPTEHTVVVQPSPTATPGGNSLHPRATATNPSVSPSPPVTVPTKQATPAPKEPATTSLVIGPDKGGVLISPDGRVRIEIPAGAVTAETTVFYRPLSDRSVASYQVIGPFFELTAKDRHGNAVSHFARPLTITVRYDDEPGRNEAQGALFYFKNNTAWQRLKTSVDTKARQLTTKVDHFTNYVSLVGWDVGRDVGLCSGTPIHHGPYLGVHTIVPEDNWLVRITGGPRIFPSETGELEVWWPTDRKVLDHLPTSGTGWVSEFEHLASCEGGDGGGGGGDALAQLMKRRAAFLAWLMKQRATWKLLGDYRGSTTAGDPVNPLTGNFLHEHTDLHLPGVAGFDLALHRTYNGMDVRDGFFGTGQSSVLDMNVNEIFDGSVDVRYPDGQGDYFTSAGGGYTPAQKGVFDTLKKEGSGFLLLTPDQTAYSFQATVQLTNTGFFTTTFLTSISDRHGNTITFERDDEGRATSITDSSKRTLTLAYDEKKHVTSIADPVGRTLTYSYNSTGDLTSFTDGNSGTYQQAYDAQHRMASLTDPAGILYLQNTYDDQQRVTEQVDASGSHSSFRYADKQTTFTDNAGHPTLYRYDERFRVTEVTDALGQTEKWAYDENDNLTSYTDKRSNSWTSTYDERGNLLSTTDPQGRVTSYTYNATNDLTSITDQGGPGNSARTTTLGRNDKGDLTSIGQPDGTSVQATYDGKGQLLSLTDANRHTSALSYDTQGNLVAVIDPLGQQTRSTYDAVGRMLQLTDANTHSVAFSYDGNDNVTTITDPKGQQIVLSYDKNDLLTKLVDRLGGVTTYQYDANLKLIAETDPEGHITKQSYDAMYNRVSTTDPRGNVTVYRYDAIYRLTEVQDALGGKTTLTYDPNGNATSVTNALGYTTQFAYDTLNQLTTLTDALKGVTTFAYDAVGRLTATTNPRHAVTTQTYDVMGRAISMRDALGGEWKARYDAVGNVISQTDANGHTTTMQYDAADRLIATTDANVHTTTIGYDAVGNPILVTNARGYATHYVYDANDNLTIVTDAKGAVTTATYDSDDQIVALTDANVHTTRFVRNRDGLITTLIEAGGQQTRFAFDATHNLITLTNAKGNAWVSTYDALNRPISETDPLHHATYSTYDALSRLTHVTDANKITTRYDYDALDRLVAVVQNDRPGAGSDVQTNVTTRYAYDSVSNLLTMTDANGHPTSYTYDRLNRLTQEVNPLGRTWEYTYDAVGNVITRTDANRHVTSYTYAPDDLLVAIAYPDATGVQFGYDAVHNQTVMTDTLGVTRNSFDEVDQLLTSMNHVGKVVTSTYDLVGNRITFSHPDGRTVRYAYDPTNFVSFVTDPDTNVFTVTHDLTHNVVRVDNPNDTFVERDIDAAERLTAVRNITNQNPHETISSYAYTLDPVGNRMRVESVYRWRKPTQLNYDYQYDPLYRLTRSEDSEGHFTAYNYDAVGNRLRLQTNDDPTLKREIDTETTTYSYDDANELLSSVREVSPRGNVDRTLQTAQMLRAFVHEVDAQTGKHITATEGAALHEQAVTLLDALEGSDPPSITDASTTISSLRSSVEQATADNTITNDGTATSLLVKLGTAEEANQKRAPELHVTLYDYDQNGNRTRRIAPDEDSATEKDWLKTDYTYDYENRLTHVQDFHTPGVPGNGDWLVMDETFVFFDGYGRVFRRQHDQHIGGGGDQEWTDYVYDGLDPVTEYRHPSHQYTNYYRGLGHILSQHDFKSQQSPVGTLYYYHYDGLDSVTGMTKHQGQSVHNVRYHDYGITLDINAHAADASNFTDPHNHYTYTGQEWDEHIELFHFYARDYEPSTGLWLQQDPYRGQLAAPKTLHRYGYVGQGPITHSDWYGYMNVSEALYLGLKNSKIISLLSSMKTPTPSSPTNAPTPSPRYEKSQLTPRPDVTYSYEVSKDNKEAVKEPAGEKYYNYCGPGATLVALDIAGVKNLPPIDTIGVNEQVNVDKIGTYTDAIASTLNKYVQMADLDFNYETDDAKNITEFEWMVTNTLSKHRALITGLMTGYKRSPTPTSPTPTSPTPTPEDVRMQGWSSSVKHIVAVTGYKRKDEKIFITYVETAHSDAGYKGGYDPITISLDEFWKFVEPNSHQVWIPSEPAPSP